MESQIEVNQELRKMEDDLFVQVGTIDYEFDDRDPEGLDESLQYLLSLQSIHPESVKFKVQQIKSQLPEIQTQKEKMSKAYQNFVSIQLSTINSQKQDQQNVNYHIERVLAFIFVNEGDCRHVSVQRILSYIYPTIQMKKSQFQHYKYKFTRKVLTSLQRYLKNPSARMINQCKGRNMYALNRLFWNCALMLSQDYREALYPFIKWLFGLEEKVFVVKDKIQGVYQILSVVIRKVMDKLGEKDRIKRSDCKKQVKRRRAGLVIELCDLKTNARRFQLRKVNQRSKTYVLPSKPPRTQAQKKLLPPQWLLIEKFNEIWNEHHQQFLEDLFTRHYSFAKIKEQFGKQYPAEKQCFLAKFLRDKMAFLVRQRLQIFRDKHQKYKERLCLPKLCSIPGFFLNYLVLYRNCWFLQTLLLKVKKQNCGASLLRQITLQIDKCRHKFSNFKVKKYCRRESTIEQIVVSEEGEGEGQILKQECFVFEE